MFLFSGLMFLLVIFWQTRKDRLYLFELEKRLEEKEKRLYELYDALEDLIRNSFPDTEEAVLHDRATGRDVQQHNQGENFRQNIDGTHSDRRKAVLLMYKGGSSEEEIARKLGIGIGEVKLILGLKNN